MGILFDIVQLRAYNIGVWESDMKKDLNRRITLQESVLETLEPTEVNFAISDVHSGNRVWLHMEYQAHTIFSCARCVAPVSEKLSGSLIVVDSELLETLEELEYGDSEIPEEDIGRRRVNADLYGADGLNTDPDIKILQSENCEIYGCKALGRILSDQDSDLANEEFERILTQDLVLNMEYRHYCSDDCTGLCVICGAKGRCDCEKVSIDPRLEVLKKLIKD